MVGERLEERPLDGGRAGGPVGHRCDDCRVDGRVDDAGKHVAFARDGDRVVGMARLLSDGVCNAYLLDVWTASAYRRQGIASGMIRLLLERVPGQHVGLQTDDAQTFWESLGFRAQPEFWSLVVGSWLDNDANR